jgi:hypothetical protein
MAEDPASRDQHRSDMAEPRLSQVHRCSTPFGINGIITRQACIALLQVTPCSMPFGINGIITCARDSQTSSVVESGMIII